LYKRKKIKKKKKKKRKENKIKIPTSMCGVSNGDFVKWRACSKERERERDHGKPPF
jgi:hypothetical protein